MKLMADRRSHENAGTASCPNLQSNTTTYGSTLLCIRRRRAWSLDKSSELHRSPYALMEPKRPGHDLMVYSYVFRFLCIKQKRSWRSQLL
ncbi:Uncharacterized protein HZ326_23450 [Fusarium oxysporum f. sp. albedinis]|nr:Uncharacterized protein HZ326_23450 [Fusarium oxysporum f. sp. albedinis]